MCKWGAAREVTVTRRISVDPCIAEAVVALNDAGVVTTGSCCGHGKGPAWATIQPSSMDRARALGYQVEWAPSGNPLIRLARPPAEPSAPA